MSVFCVVVCCVGIGFCTYIHLFICNIVPIRANLNEMGGACRSDGGGERRVQDFGGET
jgi:hypothetical protein